MPISTLKKRSEFMRVRGGRRYSAVAFLIECKVRPECGTTEYADLSSVCITSHTKTMGMHKPRFGFTVTKKMGNAIVRNRMRRRLKAAVSEIAPVCAHPSYDYVILARKSALDLEFSEMRKDLQTAFARLHGSQDECSKRRQSRKRRKRSAGSIGRGSMTQ